MAWIPQPTQDGSFTFFSEAFGESFHSRQGAQAEAVQKFAEATDLRQRAQQNQVKLLDVCYGLGYNTAAALAVIWQINPHCQVEIYGLELDPSVPLASVTPELLQCWPDRIQKILTMLAHHHNYQQDHLRAHLLIGDARQTIQRLSSLPWQADAIFFDPFSPKSCPQLWTIEFFQQVARCLAPQGKLATYSRAAAVRSALLAAGLAIGSMPLGDRHLPHEWSQGTLAAWDSRTLPPLVLMEQEHLRTQAAIPFRDLTGQDEAAVIMQRRQQEQQRSTAESTTSWKRRWGIR